MYTCTDNVFTLNMTDLGGGWGGSQWDMYDGSGNLVASNTFLVLWFLGHFMFS
jgi:hypothetical protein